MDERVINYLIHRTGEDGRRGSGGRDSMDRRRRGSGSRDFTDGRRGSDGRDSMDGRRRGRNGRFIRDSRDMRDMRNFEDFEDFDDVEDFEDSEDEPLYLTKQDMRKWKKMLKNFDGSTGEHYTLEQILSAAQKQNVSFEDYDEKEFCIAVNMMYADYGGVLKKYVPPDRELNACIDLAKAFFDDVDGPEPAEKLALYFHCIVCAKV